MTFHFLSAALTRSYSSVFAHRPPIAWLTALAMFLVIFGVLEGTLLLIRRTLKKHQGAPWAPYATHVTNRTSPWILAALALVVASHRLIFSAHIRHLLDDTAATVVFIQFALWGHAFIHAAVGHYKSHVIDGERATTIVALGFIGTILLWVLLTLAALNNLGVNITALIAGLGVGGVAFALALQTTLADVLASLSIMFDKPFVLGDHIAIETYAGTVEYIGLRTTRLTSPSGEQIIISNSDIIKSRVRNYKRMHERNITFILSVTYQNSYQNLAKIPVIAADIIAQETRVRFIRAQFADYQPQGLLFEVAYAVKEDYADLYQDIRHTINFALFNAFHDNGIEFAYQMTEHQSSVSELGAKEAP